MENVHILSQRMPTRGEFLPFGSAVHLQNKHSEHQKLVEKLQTTLDLTEMVSIYADFAARVFSFTGMQFHCSLGVFPMKNADLSNIPSSFDVHLNGEHLGQLVYFSKYPINDSIAEKLGKLHQCLLYPLRNALMYNRVLKLATKDSLTGLNNRSQFNEMLKQKLETARRQHRSFGLMLLDLDNFKQVNDVYGHKAGDDVLVEFAEILEDSVRATDTVFRFGGDEFAVLIDDPAIMTNKVVAERIMSTVTHSALLNRYNVTSSIGYTLALSNDCENALFARADKGLYQAKGAGRNCARSA
ncbi:diguanylate cyclase (GGDEF domain) with PAS/PAC sensor [Pseudoalteromonas luteoviolacea B = ATCC 29581]|nr:diguanylate cyclase (GGDEF domain) with PAS/PAC sensor [Pseudoalteromonas luteoviolacea B = ATCC 29581]